MLVASNVVGIASDKSPTAPGFGWVLMALRSDPCRTPHDLEEAGGKR
jgi:hypothetical protein